jgi:hypothetical protein
MFEFHSSSFISKYAMVYYATGLHACAVKMRYASSILFPDQIIMKIASVGKHFCGFVV